MIQRRNRGAQWFHRAGKRDHTLILVPDAVRQDGEERSLFVLLFEAEVRITPVGQTQVDWEPPWYP